MPEEAVDPEPFYAHHLALVSRSFAPCIAQLEPPLRAWVGLAYLLARVLDTAEDAPWPNAAGQQQAFVAALDLLLRPAAAADVVAWAKSLPQDLPAAEVALLADAPRLFADLHALAPAPKRAMVQHLARMAEGMRQHAGRRDGNGAVRLRDLGEVNRYCYVVAGVVGELLTQLLLLASPDFTPGAQTLVDAVHFGLFLQKVNLLKDQVRDEREGRFWLPDRTAVEQSLLHNARGAGRYLLAIPKQAAQFRLFCAWSLFLGGRSLGLYDGEAEAAKIPRAEAEALFAELGQIVTHDASLADAVQAVLAQAEASLTNRPAPKRAPAAARLWPEADFVAWMEGLGPAQGRPTYADGLALGLA